MPETTDEHKKKKPRQLFSQPELKRLEAEYAQLSPGQVYGALAKELAKERMPPIRSSIRCPGSRGRAAG